MQAKGSVPWQSRRREEGRWSAGHPDRELSEPPRADLIHLNYDDVNKMVDRYKDTYAQELVGDDLGKFHVDLPSLYEDNEVYGIESMCLGRKYI